MKVFLYKVNFPTSNFFSAENGRKLHVFSCVTSSPILRIGDQVLTFDVFWPKHLQEVRSTAYIHVQSI